MSGIANQDLPAEGPSGSEFPDPTPQEALFFYNMIKNMQNQPDIDWVGVAADSGFKNAAVAKVGTFEAQMPLMLFAARLQKVLVL